MTTAARALAPVSSMPMSETRGALVVAPQNFTEVMAFADRMAESRFVPQHLRNRPADCMAVIMQALRWEADPFSVAQKTYFTKEGAPPGYEAQLVNAIVYARAPLEGRLDIQWAGAWPNRVCTVTGRIRNDPHPKVRAVNAVTIKTRNSPLWQSDPDQQLAYYATRAWARLFTPDVLMGIYTPDEIREDMHVGPRDITPEAEPAPTRMAALERAIDTEAEPVETAEHVDPETGEVAPATDDGRDDLGLLPIDQVTDPADLLALASRLETDMQTHETQAELKAWFSDSPDVTRLRDGGGEFYTDLLGKVKSRMKALKK